MKRPLLIDLIRRNINFPLLVFLVLFLDVKFVVKIFAILFIVLSDKDLKLGLSLKNSRLPLFYFLIILVEIFKYFVVTRSYSLNYLLVFGMGFLQWAFCLLAIHHVRLNVDRETTEKTHNTIKLFFLLNFLVSMFFLGLLIFHPIWLTYWGQGSDISIYHPSAGDAILGISFDTSTANATINCMGLIFFLYKRDTVFSILCLIMVVLCTSNTTFIFSVTLLVLMIVTVRSKTLRLRCIASVLALGLMYLVVSAKNREYIHNYFVQLYILNKDTSLARSPTDSILIKDSTGKVVKVPFTTTIDSNVYKTNKGDIKKALGNFLSLVEKPAEKASSARVDSIERNYLADSAIYPAIPEETYLSKPGKLISFVQTYYYLKMTFRHFLFGAGVGNFSSKLAFRASRSGVQGTYPQKYAYISPEFRYNHLKTYREYAGMDASRHSVLNFPFSVYNQVLGEYGLVGMLLFIFCYLGYFVRRYRSFSYGRYMLVALLAFFLMEYWFELFSLVIIFELFMFLNLKESKQQEAA